MKALSLPFNDDELAALEALADRLGFVDVNDYLTHLARRSLNVQPCVLDDFLYDGFMATAYDAEEAEAERLRESPDGFKLL